MGGRTSGHGHPRVNPETVEWLLEPENPSVRYFALLELVGLSPGSPAVREAQHAVGRHGIVPRILGRQQQDGGWAPAHRLYTSKYWGTVWNLIVLGHSGVDPEDGRVLRACSHILDNSWSAQSGGFATRPARNGGGNEPDVIPCLTGNMVFSLLRLGRHDDERVQRSIEWIAAWMRADDGGSEPPKSHRYRHQIACFGRHTCFHGVVKGLKALAEVPAAKRSEKARQAVRRGAEFMLRHRVYRSSHNPNRIARPGWSNLGFPNMWNTDALEVLEILTRLGYRDERMQQALELIEGKKGEDGRWKLEHTWNGKMLVDIEKKGRPSKWVTLSALRVLRHNHGVQTW